MVVLKWILGQHVTMKWIRLALKRPANSKIYGDADCFSELQLMF
jgi:hypothetical protein